LQSAGKDDNSDIECHALATNENQRKTSDPQEKNKVAPSIEQAMEQFLMSLFFSSFFQSRD